MQQYKQCCIKEQKDDIPPNHQKKKGKNSRKRKRRSRRKAKYNKKRKNSKKQKQQNLKNISSFHMPQNLLEIFETQRKIMEEQNRILAQFFNC